VADKAEIFRTLRAKVLALTPADIKVTPLATGVWGALMEFTSGQTWVSLVAILDGTTSLCFGSGGGIIGAGKSEVVRKANLLFLEVAGKFVSRFRKVDSYPTPQPERVCFYILMADGVYASGEIARSALQTSGNEILPLYTAAQNVIAQIRPCKRKLKGTPSLFVFEQIYRTVDPCDAPLQFAQPPALLPTFNALAQARPLIAEGAA
jgi:hypothetical protein